MAKIRFSPKRLKGYHYLSCYFSKKGRMPASEWYKKWFSSEYYHKLYFYRDDNEAQAFIDQLLSYLKPAATALMLDVACGKGRHSRFLASKGFDLTGIDISLESIEYAKQFENNHLHFYQHDMRLPFWINYFDYAFNFFTSFGYFNTRRENEDAIRTIVNSLKSSGVAVFDYLNVHYIEERLVHNEEKTIDGSYYEIHRWHDADFFYKKIIVSDAKLDQPMEFTEKVAKLSLGDFTDMLSFQKMQVTDAFGNYDLAPYHVKNTPRMIIIARKNN